MHREYVLPTQRDPQKDTNCFALLGELEDVDDLWTGLRDATTECAKTLSEDAEERGVSS